MNLPRRHFLKTSLAASATAALAPSTIAASDRGGRDFYELRCYGLKPDTRLKSSASRDKLEGYIENAMLPALERRGVKNVGVFTEVDVNRADLTTKPKVDSPLWVFIPHTSLESFVTVSADLNTDAAVQKAGAAYLDVGKDAPPFERVDTWLLRAFKGMPRLELPAFSKNRTPTRFFEMRTYESYSEIKALKKMAMFDDGEIDVMKDIGMSPLFFGQALAGKNLPHLTYITGAADLATHFGNWKKFSTHPGWVKMKDLPEYKDTVSKNIPFYLVPTPYSAV